MSPSGALSFSMLENGMRENAGDPGRFATSPSSIYPIYGVNYSTGKDLAG